MARPGEIQVSQAVVNLRADLGDPQAVLDHQLAGQCGTGGGALTHINRDSAVLAVLIPAEGTVGDSLRGEVLQTAQDGIVLRNFEFPAQHPDFYQPGKWAKECARSGHAPDDCRQGLGED